MDSLSNNIKLFVLSACKMSNVAELLKAHNVHNSIRFTYFYMEPFGQQYSHMEPPSPPPRANISGARSSRYIYTASDPEGLVSLQHSSLQFWLLVLEHAADIGFVSLRYFLPSALSFHPSLNSFLAQTPFSILSVLVFRRQNWLAAECPNPIATLDHPQPSE